MLISSRVLFFKLSFELLQMIETEKYLPSPSEFLHTKQQSGHTDNSTATLFQSFTREIVEGFTMYICIIPLSSSHAKKQKVKKI